MGVIAIIPARLSSTRLPRKVLLSETGKPLVAHVVEMAFRSDRLDRVVVAGDDQEIVDALAQYDVEVVLTDVDHPNGTSRLAQTAQILGLSKDDIIVNIQGDEPEMNPKLIDDAVEAYIQSGVEMGTLASPIQSGDDVSDPNLVKVVTRKATDGVHRALYFSRSVVPFDRDGSRPEYLKHAGLYVYRRGFLDRFVSWPISQLESIEKLEQLRAIEAGVEISVAISPFVHKGIDTPADYQAFVARQAQ
ncbi:MAG: 3-deoxy-manno-octulosonate cytidylyltransferase [Phycisphaerales bacterium]|nr:3-deoxy-manno-octulosonate cytidylyltransferase [Phycisphaerales bacterium]